MARSYSRDSCMVLSSSSPTKRERLMFLRAACCRAQAAVFSSTVIVTFFMREEYHRVSVFLVALCYKMLAEEGRKSLGRLDHARNGAADEAA